MTTEKPAAQQDPARAVETSSTAEATSLPDGYAVRRIGPGDLALMDGLLAMFGDAFGDVATYTGNRPGDAYLRRLLASEDFVAIAALFDGAVVGGLAAYVLHKFEQERSEIYIYDLAVAEAHRRHGLASALIGELRAFAAACGAWQIYVQADTGEEDAAAIALYSRLATPQEVLHFDIPPGGRHGTA